MGLADQRGMRKARDKSGRGRDKRGGLKADPGLEVRRRVKGLLARLDLLELFEAMPAKIRNQFYCIQPDPVLVFDSSFPSAEAFGGSYRQIRETVQEGFASTRAWLNGWDLTVRDCWAVVPILAATVRGTLASCNSPIYRGPQPMASMRMFLEAAKPALEDLEGEEVRHETFNALYETVVAPLVSRSHLDTRLLYSSFAHVPTPRGPKLVMTLYAEEPPVKYVRLEGRRSGGSRPMHRVGTANVWDRIEWASWTRESLKGHWQDEVGIPDGEEWPVYVQSHALKQLRERLNAYAYADWAEHWMNASLMKPKIVSKLSGEELLVAFEIQEKRLGYFVVTAKNGMVAVRTFLFLTMANTPEGRMLERRLKLTRDELSYLGLHELSRFTQTDLKDDPRLSQLLRECGCGHLLELAEEEDAIRPGAVAPKPFAAELRQYVGMAA
jgi:hypothetical protein